MATSVKRRAELGTAAIIAIRVVLAYLVCSNLLFPQWSGNREAENE
jgi:hypothetical protein